MTPNTHISVTLTPELRLKQALKKASIKRTDSVRKLTITGTLTLEDFHFIQTKMRRTLQALNMGDASIGENKIPDWAFNHCTGLVSVTIPNSALEIGKCAFWECTSLVSVIIPDSVSKIGDDAFHNCASIGIGVSRSIASLEKTDDTWQTEAIADAKSNQLRTWFEQFFPENTLNEVINMVRKYPIHLKVNKPRRSVLGTYIPQYNRNYHIITINGDLNKYAFLEVFLHEYAHLLVQIEYGSRGHGIEWKNIYRGVLHYFIRKNLFPNDICFALHNYMIKTYAKSTAELNSVLRKYGESDYCGGKIDYCCCFHS
jgi:predicted SprT family Zn-dependent metalloprotease